MRIPAIQGIIDRRILANYRVVPEVMAAALPPPFRPLVVGGFAIGGVCLIRLKHIRPRFLPIPWGLSSENAAHRIAVEWESNGRTERGVYIPRRDTNSRLNSLVGGRLFPGTHHHARFAVCEDADQYTVTMRSDDGQAELLVAGALSTTFPDSSVFPSLEAASDFFAQGSLGYSATGRPGTFDGLELRCSSWHVQPLAVDMIRSSYFEDTSRFPPGSAEFDCALLMRDIAHQWHGREELCCTGKTEQSVS